MAGRQPAQPGYYPPQPGYNPSNHSYQQQSSYQPHAPGSAHAPGPLIQNPFPLPGQEPGPGGKYDPEYEAQVAQWQSAYLAKEDPNRPGFRNKDAGYAVSAAAQTEGSSTGGNHDTQASNVPAKPLTVVRHGGGKTWEDPSLMDWGNDPRLFVGNLAGEVTDESLLKAFSKYNAARARVIRDKRTTKSKGYGFVSFKDGNDFFIAAKEMVGKYIGSHPVTIKRADKISTPSQIRDSKQHGKNRKSNFKDGHAHTGAGVRKVQKPKGPKLLG